MSFFIRGNENRRGLKRKNENRKRKQSTKHNQEELSSSEDEMPRLDLQSDSPSEDETETAQEKKLRLAKIYLTEIKEQEKKRREATGHVDDDDVNAKDVNKRLQEDYLRTIGKLRSLVAHKYLGHDLNKIKVLKSKFLKKSITCLFITSDGKFIFSGGKDGNIVKWSLAEGKFVDSIPFTKDNSASTIKGHSTGITGIAVSGDMKFLVVSDGTKDIQVWNPLNLQHLSTLKGHRDTVTDIVFRKDTHMLYSCSKDSSVKVWSLDEMAYVETLFGHQGPVMSIDALTRERAVTSGRDSTVRMWKFPEESQLIYTPQAGSIDIVKLINEENFVSGGDAGNLCIWGINKKKPLYIVPNAHGLNVENGQPYWISSIACLLNTDLIATGSHDGSIVVWRLTDSYHKCETLFKIPINGFINSLAFTPDGKYLIAGIGREHKFGRWAVIKTVKVSLVIIPLLKTEN